MNSRRSSDDGFGFFTLAANTSFALAMLLCFGSKIPDSPLNIHNLPAPLSDMYPYILGILWTGWLVFVILGAKAYHALQHRATDPRRPDGS